MGVPAVGVADSPAPDVATNKVRGLPSDRSVQVEPRKIDLPVGADPSFDQTDPLGTAKQMDQLLAKLKQPIATASAEATGSAGATGSAPATGAAKATGSVDVVKELGLPDIGELLKVVASASADLATW